MHEYLSERSKIQERIIEKRIGRDVPQEMPKISVIIPVYNVSAFIEDTLESIINQTFEDFEIIIVNDGSKDTDELEKVLDKYFDKTIYVKQENGGASKARNLAITLARGEFIAFIDGDDIWYQEYLASQIENLENNHLDMIYCDADLFGTNYLKANTYMQTSPSEGVVNPKSLINGKCSVITSGTVLRKEMLEVFGLFDTSVNGYEDFDLWFRLSKNNAKISYQRKILLKYRVSSISLSGSSIKRAERAVDVLRLLDEKYALTDEEKESWLKHMAICQSGLELEKSKICLIAKDYKQAQIHIAKANDYINKPKLTLLKWLLKVSPETTLKLFKKLRPAEFSFITPGQTQPEQLQPNDSLK